MRKRHFLRRNLLIIFNSKVLTIKSIYRKKLEDGKYKVFLNFNEIPERYILNVRNIDLLKGFRRGELVTLHAGNGGYVSIEKGNTIPQDGKIRVCEI